ncbi:MAG: fructosamine kinase family protein, partial [Methylococcaceae bacterium]
MWKNIEKAIRQHDPGFTLVGRQSCGGGCINDTWRLQGRESDYFIKLNAANLADMFAAEAAGLEELAATDTVRVPRVVYHGVAGKQAFLVLEYLDLRAGGGAADSRLGEQLAALHRIRQPYFGWQRDNTIGSTPQPNGAATDWIAFWSEQRLGFQLRLAAKKGGGNRLQSQGERLLENLPALFTGYQPQPSLLHGDLWGGNYAVTSADQPVIFDPACYYGDREADLAMSELFGGFSSGFQVAYRSAWPV